MIGSVFLILVKHFLQIEEFIKAKSFQASKYEAKYTLKNG